MTKLIYSSIFFLILTAASDTMIATSGYGDMNRIFRRDDANIFSQTGCIKFDEKSGYKPVWGNCGYPDLSEYVMKNTERNILGLSASENIVILGDSNSDWTDYDSILETRLNKEMKNTGRSFKAINLGVAGYNTSQEVNLFLTDAGDIPATAVILQMSPNDLESAPVFLTDNNETRIINADGTLNKPNQFLFRHSAIYRLFVSASTGNRNKNISLRDRAEEVKRSLQRLVDYTREKKIRLIAVIYPVFSRENRSETGMVIRKILKEMNIEFLDLSENREFRENPEQYSLKTANGTDFTHSDRMFDALAAEEIYRLLTEKSD